MDKKNIVIVLFLVLILAVFFQYNRMDGFVRLIKNTNSLEAQIGNGAFAANAEQSALARDHFLVIYDPANISSLFLRRMVENMARDQKKIATAVSTKQAIDWSTHYDGVLIGVEDLNKITDFTKIYSYMENGGTVCFMFRPQSGDQMQKIAQMLGIQAMGAAVNTSGVRMKTDFLVGAKSFALSGTEYMTEATQVTLNENAKLHMSSYDGLPLLWETKIGKGKAIVYNGGRIFEKTNRGLLAGMLSKTKEDYVYPIIGMKLFYIDDFPSPEPEGNFDKIYKELHLSTSEFYREVWWPMMLKMAERYDVKYTGLIIESYNDRVKSPFTPDAGRKARDNLVVYGRELLKFGGELGIHGYNHQSLAPEGYGQKELGYAPWQSQADMVASLTELKRYIKEVYPDYEIKSYVPPSNILSPEGKAAVTQAFPEIKIFSSLYNGAAEERAYYQSFEKSADGIYEIPRVTSGYIMNDSMRWESINVINAVGVFSHFVHPDELFYKESQNLSWHDMSKGFEALMKDTQKAYGWLRASTASQGAAYMDEYFNLDYRTVQEDNLLQIYCWGFKTEVQFIFKTEKEIVKYDGCQVEQIGEGVYLITVSNAKAIVELKDREIK